MKEKIAIIGAGGHGRVCAEIAELNGYREVVFLDDGAKAPVGYTILGKTDILADLIENGEYDFFVGIGNNTIRQQFIEKIQELGGELATLVHPRSIVSSKANLGDGTVVMAGAVINPGATTGIGAIANTCSSMDHDCNIGACSHVGVATHLAGTVITGIRAFIGAGAIVINNIKICQDAIIGAGAVVVSNIDEQGTYVGVPARKIK